ncbi:MAG: glycosyltransferase [Chitinophagales bacterium]|nr:glycosyltransferase [Chitinophagales bacterium]
MKTIIFTVTNDLSYDRRMQRICGSLVRAGFKVTLVGRQLRESKPLEVAGYAQKRLICWFRKGKLFYLEFNIRLFWYLLFQQADIYGAIDLDTLVPNVWVGKWKGKKVVYDAHEYFSEVPEVVHRPTVKKIWEWVASTFIPKVDAAYTIGPALAKIFQERYGLPFETIMNVPSLQPDVQPQGKYLLYQGALNKGRGLEALIMAMHQIDKPLKIAGEGDLSANLRAMVQSEGLEQKIEFLGFVKPADLPALTQGAWLGFNLLENMGLSYYYSLANKCFDYIQAGVPTLNMDFPEYKALNQQFEIGLLLDNLDSSTIVKAVTDLEARPELYHRLSQNCFLAKKQLNWQAEEQKLVNLYLSV